MTRATITYGPDLELPADPQISALSCTLRRAANLLADERHLPNADRVDRVLAMVDEVAGELAALVDLLSLRRRFQA